EIRCDYEEAEKRLQAFLLKGPEPVPEAPPVAPPMMLDNLENTLSGPPEAIQTPDSLSDFGEDPFGISEDKPPSRPQMPSGGGSLLDPLDDEYGSVGITGAMPMGMAEEVEPDMHDIVASSLNRMVS